MSFKEEFAALCEKYNVAFDISDNPKVALFNSFVAGWCVAIAVVRYLQVTNNI